MSKKKTDKTPNVGLPIADVIAPRSMLEVGASTVELRKMNEIAELIWFHEDIEDRERNARIVRALELYRDLKPSGSAEGMLAAQMVGTHTAALECLRRAVLNNQTFEGRNMNLNQAQKLMTLYAKQLATLDKHRGKGQQKVTVEYVNVESGGQAIVGHIETSRADKGGGENTAIELSPEVPLPEVTAKSAAPRKRS